MNKDSDYKKIKMLLVEDNKADAEAVKRALREHPAYIIQHVETIKQAEDALLNKPSPDLVLLDLGLPDDNGLNLLTKIRQSGNIPVIIVSANDYVIDKIIGLEMGADDYVAKPYEAREFHARIKAILRRSQNKVTSENLSGQNDQQMKFDGWILDKSRYELYNKDGNPVGLTTAEFRLLEVLMKSQQRVLSRSQLYNAIYDTEYGHHDRAIDIMIGRIRKKIGDSLDHPKYIKTIRGIGYMFCADTETLRKTA